MKYCYTTLLFPNKNGKVTYLEGAILMALGLKRQNAKYDLVCIVTPDVDKESIDVLNIFFDKVVCVNYITPVGEDGIKVCKELFKPSDYTDDNNYGAYAHVFTKLHIFDSNLFPYEKVLFIDTDIIPLSDYDSLFELDTPAGWLELIPNEKNNRNYCGSWGVWDDIHHGELIPRKFTDCHKKPGRNINAGLLLVKPDHDEFANMIKQIQDPTKHKGSLDIFGRHKKYYEFPEEGFLTSYFSSKWKMIDGLFASWGLREGSKGVHMAGLKYYVLGQEKKCKTWRMQNCFDDIFSKPTNEVVLWGINKYPELKKVMFRDLEIKVGDHVIQFSKINKRHIAYLLMSKKLQELHDLLF